LATAIKHKLSRNGFQLKNQPESDGGPSKLYNRAMTLARYLLRQFLPPFAFGLSLFSGVLLLDKIFDLIDLLVNKGVGLGLSLQIFFLFLPTIMSLSVPMSMLLACLLTFGRLSEDNEILALRASGLSFRQILWPPLAFALLLGLLLIPFNTRLTPAAMGRFRTLYHKIASADPLVQMEPRRFFAVQNIRLYAEEVAKDHRVLKNVWLYRVFPDATERIHAGSGRVDTGPDRLTLRLTDGQMERVSADKPDEFLHMGFREYDLGVPLRPEALPRDRGWREYTGTELRREINARRARGQPAGEIQSEFHLRFALAFAPIALALIGIPLGMTLERGGRGVGFGAAIVVIFVYYLLLVMGMNLAERNTLPAAPALWIANGVAALLGLGLYRQRVAQ
jgi:lipopolysaccharide export system permease protein